VEYEYHLVESIHFVMSDFNYPEKGMAYLVQACFLPVTDYIYHHAGVPECFY
jgi:hypothetical protein